MKLDKLPRVPSKSPYFSLFPKYRFFPLFLPFFVKIGLIFVQITTFPENDRNLRVFYGISYPLKTAKLLLFGLFLVLRRLAKVRTTQPYHGFLSIFFETPKIPYSRLKPY
jgi:hypothetical protein